LNKERGLEVQKQEVETWKSGWRFCHLCKSWKSCTWQEKKSRPRFHFMGPGSHQKLPPWRDLLINCFPYALLSRDMKVGWFDVHVQNKLAYPGWALIPNY